VPIIHTWWIGWFSTRNFRAKTNIAGLIRKNRKSMSGIALKIRNINLSLMFQQIHIILQQRCSHGLSGHAFRIDPGDEFWSQRRYFIYSHANDEESFQWNLEWNRRSSVRITSRVCFTMIWYSMRLKISIYFYSKPYTHFLSTHTKTLDENFYRRSMRYKRGEIVVDVNATSTY